MGLIGEKVRCVQGSGVPILRKHDMGCPEIHGDCGLGGANWPQKASRKYQNSQSVSNLREGNGDEFYLNPIAEEPAVVVMAKKINDYYNQTGHKVTLICTGTLTNAALLLLVYPEISSKIEIVFMGGAVGAHGLVGLHSKSNENNEDLVHCLGPLTCLGNTGVVAEFNIQVAFYCCKH